MLRVVAATGMRRGEVCALRWRDVDLDHGVVRINESVVAAVGGAIVKAPKTRASIRTVAIDSGTVSVLRDIRTKQTVLADTCGLKLAPEAFLFSNEAGAMTPPHPDGLSHTFASIRAKAKIAPDVHMHSLRHFHATRSIR